MSRKFFIFISFLCLLLGAEIVYLSSKRSLTPKKIELKKYLVSSSHITDLAVSNETRSVRQRSTVEVFSVFSESPELLEYFPTTFVYAPSSNLKITPSRIEIE
jgi:hypothetical protein